jgi:hypothetical protein
MIVADYPLLLLAMGAMVAAALAVDLLRQVFHRGQGEMAYGISELLLLDIFFFALFPSFLYGWMYPLVPFGGLRAGLFLGSFMVLLAVLPTLASFRLNAPSGQAAGLGHLFWLLVKYLLVYGLLTYIYQP